jgi:hypothetical protein
MVGRRSSPAVLGKPSTWGDRDVDYEKGAHVLAALDAQIRDRTNGTRTLQNVLDPDSGAEYARVTSYADLRERVVTVSGDEELGEWLDRYVLTEALPAFPESSSWYVLNESRDSDGDGYTNGEAVVQGRNPFPGASDGTEQPVASSTKTHSQAGSDSATESTSSHPSAGGQGTTTQTAQSGAGFTGLQATLALVLVSGLVLVGRRSPR